MAKLMGDREPLPGLRMQCVDPDDNLLALAR